MWCFPFEVEASSLGILAVVDMLWVSDLVDMISAQKCILVAVGIGKVAVGGNRVEVDILLSFLCVEKN